MVPSCSQLKVQRAMCMCLLGEDFNIASICWKGNVAGFKQSRKLVESSWNPGLGNSSTDKDLVFVTCRKYQLAVPVQIIFWGVSARQGYVRYGDNYSAWHYFSSS